MAATDTVDIYMHTLENRLRLAEVPADQQKFLLVTRLTRLLQEFVADLAAQGDTTCEDVCSALLENTEESTTKAGQDYLELKPAM